MSTVDSGSDGENSERPVRERLKQTTIAKTGREADDDSDADDAQLINAEDAEMNVTESDGKAPNGAASARARRKRSFEDLGKLEANNTSDSLAEDRSSTHIRKRPKDIGHLDGSSADKDTAASSGKDENMAQAPEVEETSTTTPRATSPVQKSSSVDDSADTSLLSPRRKRSRESVDAGDGGPEQKIPSNNETRARRSSSEERPSLDDQSTGTGTGRTGSKNSETSSNSKPVFGEILKPKPIEKKADPPQTSSSAFASSGFASLAGSASAFGSKSTATSKPFSPPSSTSSFASSGNSQTSAFGAGLGGVQSSFASAAGSQSAFGGSFGGSTFGGGFGSGFGSGPRLSSFAAPVGDAKLENKSKDKPFGAVNDGDAGEKEKESDVSTEGGEDADDDATTDTKEEDESTSKFKAQDVNTGEDEEDSVFNNRGKLFQYHADEKAWKERGVGPFKINIQRPATDAQGDTNGNAVEDSEATANSSHMKARFIMRNHATHKVILNTPIFKEMSVKEQSGKQLLFICPSESGDMTTYTVRMGKEEDIKHLLKLVRDLQSKM